MKTIFTLFICCLTLPVFSQADLKDKCFTLYRFLEKDHYKPVEWNDSNSSRLFNKFIDELDEDKLIFSKTDMKQLESFRYQLDDEVTGKQWLFLKAIMPLFKLRVQQFDSTVISVLSKPFDLTKSEQFQWPAPDFAANQQDLQTRVRQFYKWESLSMLADSVVDLKATGPAKLPANFAAVESYVRNKLAKREKLSMNETTNAGDFEQNFGETFLNAMVWMYDPHSEFMNFAEKEDFQSQVTASEYTTGLTVEKDDKGQCTISYLVPGGPAWRSGELHAGDILVSIKTSGAVETNTDELSEGEIEGMLSGSAGDRVTIVVKNAAGTQKTVALEKEKISSDESIVRSYILNADKKIGYIQLPGFYSRFEEDDNTKGCANDVAKEVIKLKRDNIDGLVLDLRNNGGGSMQEALELAGIFINEGPLCLIKEKTGKVVTLRDPNRGTIYDGPLVVLINGASASASELTSAVLQDYHRALIVGGNTYGKGTAQVVLPLDTAEKRVPKTTGDFIKVTERKFYRVDGNTVQWKGVVPDISLPDPYQQERFKERAQSSALRPDTCKKANFNALQPLPSAALAERSAARIHDNNYFKNVAAFSSWLATAEQTRSIPLQWDKYAAYYKERIAIYKMMENAELDTRTFYKADNNSVDKERSGILAPQTRAINENWLKELEHDRVLEEAARILQNWLGVN